MAADWLQPLLLYLKLLYHEYEEEHWKDKDGVHYQPEAIPLDIGLLKHCSLVGAVSVCVWIFDFLLYDLLALREVVESAAPGDCSQCDRSHVEISHVLPR